MQQNHVIPSKKYAFFSGGTAYFFDPNKNANLNGRLVTSLDFHISEVKFRNSPDVYILNDTGEVLKV